MAIAPPITDSEVIEISASSSSDLTPFIRVANSIITAHFADTDLSDELIREIAIYLAAHFAFLHEGQVKSEKIGASSTTFNLATDLALMSTTFGQQAIFLDSSGVLAQLQRLATQKAKAGDAGQASLEVIG